MTILLYGPDTYSRQCKLVQFREGVVKRNPDVVQGSFDLSEDGTLYTLHEFASVRGLFSQGKRIAVVRGALGFFGNEAFVRIVSRAAHDPDVLLLLQEDRDRKLDRKTESFCKKNDIQVQYFAKPTVATVRTRVQEHAVSIGVTIDSRALDFLIEARGQDIYALVSDIDKWSAVSTKIDVPFLSKTGEYAAGIGVFDFSQSVLYRKPLAERLSLFEGVSSQGIDLYAAFNIIAKMTASKDLIDLLAAADLKIKKGLLDI